MADDILFGTPNDYGSPVNTDTVFIPSAPGNDTTPVPTSDPWTFDPFAVLKKVGDAAAAGVTAYSNITNARNNFELQRLKTNAQVDLAQAQIRSQALTDQYRIAAQTATAQRQFGAMPGLSVLLGGNGTASKSDGIMLILTALGVYFAWRAVKHA